MGNRIFLIAAVAAGCALAQPAPPAPPKSHGAMGPFAMHGPRLGVGVMDVDADRAKALKLKDTRGTEVTRVDNDTPAAKAGIKVGDVITEYNGHPVQDTEELQRLVQHTAPGTQVKIELWRNGAPVTVTATVEEGAIPGWANGNWGNGNWGGGDWPFGGNFPPMPTMPSIDIPRMVTTFQSSALGTECEALSNNPQLAEFFGVKDGLLVRSVARDSAAEKAGIKAGDVIVKIGETRIANMRDLSAAIRAAHAKGGPLPVTVMRNHHEMAVTVNMQEAAREHF
jgi:serine protease Do